MEDDLGVNLSLNLIPDDVLASKLDHKRGKIFGDRRSRVKQRKELQKEKEHTKKSIPQEKSTSGKKRKREESTNANTGLGEDQDTASNTRDGIKKSKSTVVISSLFRKNPEVPVISKWVDCFRAI
ncbi:RNA helicase [Plakobranchus ocellatus]|uniref:RNA helicase n=1 Tax=Plakobranchus ocellatus TaxID=259542 RepID=A0AAV4B9C0_9GAST|nr:RNA helicase [Plakobranchus ocellatus]